MIAITAPTGQIGTQVLGRILDSGSFSWFRVGGSLLAALSLASGWPPGRRRLRSDRFGTPPPSACAGGETKGLNSFHYLLPQG